MESVEASGTSNATRERLKNVNGIAESDVFLGKPAWYASTCLNSVRVRVTRLSAAEVPYLRVLIRAWLSVCPDGVALRRTAMLRAPNLTG
eukprot:1433046-Pleurochrysis_carterae.AAC.2